MTDLDPKAAPTAASRRAALAHSRHLRVEGHHVPPAYTVVVSDLTPALAAERKQRDRSGLWFALGVVLTVVVLVAYNALVGFG
ncbi:hypothetical protein ACTVCO_01485 [Sanguibacter sp. A247]|uniref:hypothetical protein n=1 Tax=unclassified Sanguibacter TaxID=2645534 RepID=UPI003FD7134B